MGLFKNLFGGKSSPENEKEKSDKRNFEILKYDGIRAQRMGKTAYAIKCLEQAAALEEDPETLHLLSVAYTQTGRLDDARATLERMLRNAPDDSATQLSLAGLCFLQEDYTAMDAAAREAIRLDSENPLGQFLAARAAIGLKDPITAIAMLTRAILLKPDYTEAIQLRAEVLWDLKQAQEAGQDIETLLQLNPEDEQALLLRGRILAATGHTDEAQECFAQVRSLNPFNEQAYLLAGELHLTLKTLDEARALYDEAIEINPRFALAYRERGRIKLLQGDKDGSMEDMKKALELAPENEEAITGQYNNYEQRNIPF